MNQAQTAYVGCQTCRHQRVLVTFRDGRADKIYYDFQTTLRNWYDAPGVTCPNCGTPKRFLNEKGEEYRRDGLRLVAVE